MTSRKHIKASQVVLLDECFRAETSCCTSSAQFSRIACPAKELLHVRKIIAHYRQWRFMAPGSDLPKLESTVRIIIIAEWCGLGVSWTYHEPSDQLCVFTIRTNDRIMCPGVECPTWCIKSKTTLFNSGGRETTIVDSLGFEGVNTGKYHWKHTKRWKKFATFIFWPPDPYW